MNIHYSLLLDVRGPVTIAYGSNESYTYIGILGNSGALTQTGIYALQGVNINLINNVTNISSFFTSKISSTGMVSNFSKIGSSNIFSVSLNGFQSYDLNDYQITINLYLQKLNGHLCILFKTLVSIVSLRELNFQEINSNKHQYFTSINVPSTTLNSNETTTNIMAIQIKVVFNGRFIKRAIVDSQVISIENEQLDSSMNPLLIVFSITLDPDFSVLVDDKSVSSGDNSICSKSSSSICSNQR
ncbi:hypothetical protein ACTFIY_002634 [Dictyostelium cf. discoideum]